MGPRTGLEAVGKENRFPAPVAGIEPWSVGLARSLVIILTEIIRLQGY
jgi:hypothetical protein